MSRWLPGFMVVAIASLALTAQAKTIHYRSTLGGMNESPENSSPAIGNVQITIDDEDHTMRIQSVFNNLMGKTTGSRLEGPTTNGGTAQAITAMPNLSGFPLGVKSGTYNKTLDLTKSSTYNPAFIAANGGSVSKAEKALLAMLAAGKVFFNVPTTSVPNGEISGFPQAFDPTPVSSASWSRVKALYR